MHWAGVKQGNPGHSQSTINLSQTFTEFDRRRYEQKASTLPALNGGRRAQRLALAREIAQEAVVLERPCRMCSAFQEKGQDGVRKLLLENEHLRRGMSKLLDAMEALISPQKLELLQEALHLEVRWFTRPEEKQPEQYDHELQSVLGTLNLSGNVKALQAEVAFFKHATADMKKKADSDTAAFDSLRAKMTNYTPRKSKEVVNAPLTSYSGTTVRIKTNSEGCQTDPIREPEIPRRRDRASSPCFPPREPTPAEPKVVYVTREPRRKETPPPARPASRCSTAEADIAPKFQERERKKYSGPVIVPEKAAGPTRIVVEQEKPLPLPPRPVMVDVGCGPGPGFEEPPKPVAEKPKKKEPPKEQITASLYNRVERPTPKLGFVNSKILPSIAPPLSPAPSSTCAQLNGLLSGFFGSPGQGLGNTESRVLIL